MKKLVRGIIEFRRNAREEYREKFARLALGQSPDALFIACSDSRVVPNVFASTDPGDLFVVRNVGNLVPCCEQGVVSAESETAAIDYAVLTLNVSDIVVCGHSECAAMKALVDGREKFPSASVREWLRHGEPALTRLSNTNSVKGMTVHNILSQQNVIQQIEHLKSYPAVQERMAAGKLKIHGWWFELASANVFAYNPASGTFILVDESEIS